MSLVGGPDPASNPARRIAAYSEFMPSPRVVPLSDGPLDEADPWGWRIGEREELEELGPGLEQVTHQWIGTLARLMQGRASHGFSPAKLQDNPYWPPELSGRAGSLDHERLVCLTPLALSKTQDDKGRVRWTLFGGSELGPSRPFWQSSFDAPGRERPAGEALGFLARLLAEGFDEQTGPSRDLHKAGLRILPEGDLPDPLPSSSEGPLPSWTGPFLLDESRPIRGVRYLLTFRPFGHLPAAVRKAYLAGSLHLLPCPASLIPWGVGLYLKLRKTLPTAMQIPLLTLIARSEGAGGLRVPQSGWLHEPRPWSPEPGDHHGPIRATLVRTHRNERTRRDDSAEPPVTGREDRMAHVLFSASESDLGLYGKPMARNARVWSDDARLILDGPVADRASIDSAARALEAGGHFGYRMQYPAMRLGDHEVTWHRPLVAYLPTGQDRPVVVSDAPLGCLTATHSARPDLAGSIVLWPRPLRREGRLAALELFHIPGASRPHRIARDCLKCLDAHALLGEPLPRTFAQRLRTGPTPDSLDDWLAAIAGRAVDPDRGARLADEIRRCIGPEQAAQVEPLTLARTSSRGFEVAYWRSISALACGRFPNRNNADPALGRASHGTVPDRRRDLEELGDVLRRRHARSIAAAGMTGQAEVADLPFRWRTDFDLDWSGGWTASQGPILRERDLIVIIPGRDRSRALIMADHYDTAYMEDRYRRDGARIAAPGADDNTSATAALLMAAPPLLELSKTGRLGCDVWLVHLTGEEFPADCLGARHLASEIVGGTLTARRPDGGSVDLSGVRVAGVFVLDMVAHDNPRRRGTFQIAPGTGPDALGLAVEAHHAAESWNAMTPLWDRHPARRAAGVGRSRGPRPVPTIARHPTMTGEVRPHDDPRSTLYNTDAQIFSDAGIPSVLLMEDYDIDRKGYHDSRDTMAGVDLPYGAALAAIAIEAVARATSIGGHPT